MKDERIKKLKARILKATRLYNRSMRMATKYDNQIIKMEKLLDKLESV